MGYFLNHLIRSIVKTFNDGKKYDSRSEYSISPVASRTSVKKGKAESNNSLYHLDRIKNGERKEITIDIVYERLTETKGRLVSENASSETIFFEMAKLVQNIEEDQFIHGRFIDEEIFSLRNAISCRKNFHYLTLSKDSLHRYFSWRSAMRLWVSEPNLPNKSATQEYLEAATDCEGFILLYMAELINLIGVSGPEQGYYCLNKLKQLHSNMDKVLGYKDIIHDYQIYYGLGIPQERHLNEISKKFYKNDFLSLKSYFKLNSAYDYRKSSFYTHEKGYLIEEIMPHVLNSIYNYFLSQGLDLSCYVGGCFIKREWKYFNGYPFINQNRQNPITVFNPDCYTSYAFIENEWFKFEWSHPRFKEAFVGYAYKITEKYLREYYKQNSNIVVNFDKMIKDGHATSGGISSNFAKLLYGEECNQIIKQTVLKFVK